MDPGTAQQIQLKSYSSCKLELPVGAQILIPKEAPAKAIPRELSLAKLRDQLLTMLRQAETNGTQSTIRVLFLFHDKTS